MLATAGAALVGWRAGPDSGATAVWAAAISWFVAWLVAARFRWATTRRRVAWLVLLGLAWAAATFGRLGGLIPAVIVGGVFMLRHQLGFRLLVGRQRVLAFLLGLPILVLTFVAGMHAPGGAARGVVVMGRTGVELFWVSAILTMLFGMRLHFLRLRPKLLVAGVLVGVVPLVLLSLFGLTLLYGSLGGSRANRARDVLAVWAETFGQGRVPEAFTSAPVIWDEAQQDAGPVWAADLVAAARTSRRELALGAELPRGEDDLVVYRDDDDGEVRLTGAADDEPWLPRLVAAADTSAWLKRDGEVWLVRLRDPGPGQARVDALNLDVAVLDRLAKMLRVDVVLPRSVNGGEDGEADSTAVAQPLSPALAGSFTHAPVDSAAGFWSSSRFFGAALVPAPRLEGRTLSEGQLVLALKTSFADLAREFFSRDNAANIGIMVVLGALAVLLMFAGLVALIFSFRITGGITGAVAALHLGTRRLAAGDLDTRIEIPNEDEFGDLAQSFNEMAVAVKQGREDALARERLTAEMATARRIQQRLLPHEQPLLSGWDITGVSIPSLQVGGDYFDFITVLPGRLGIAIGDVSGKGVPAALLMSNLQACLKGQVLHPASVAETVTRINDLLSESTEPHVFATFFYGELDGASGRFTCTSAGHDPAIVVRQDGTVERVSSGGLLLGMFGGLDYAQVEIVLAPGDVLVLYTDGISEAGAPLILPGDASAEEDDDEAAADLAPQDAAEDAMFGDEQLAEVIVAARARSAVGIREAVLAAVQAHLAGRPQGDDITLVVVKRTQAPAD